MSLPEHKTRDYWEASSELARPIVELTEHRDHKEKLWRLYRCGPSHRLRNVSHKRLVAIGDTVHFIPAPDGGTAA